MTESSPILVPLDGSDFSEQAIPVAFALAERWHAPLRLARVHVPLTSEVHCADGLVVMDNRRDLEARQRDAAYLEQRRATASGAAAETVLLQGPGVPTALARDIGQSGARLVVMTTHGRSGLPRLLLGSVAGELVRRSPAPVLLVRPRAEQAPGQFRRVLVPLDDTELARSILCHATRVAEPGAQLVLLTVIEPLSWQSWPDHMGTPAPDEREREAAARAWLEETAEPLRALGFQVETRVSLSRHCAQEILAVAREIDANLVALATHGRSGLVRAALGSVADQVVRGTVVPVLLLHPLRHAAAPSAELEREAR
jgi:nucleotide-binding universal stress UspA family protein